MPLIERSDYRAPWWLPGGHLQTIWPNLCRLVPGIAYEREALELPDGDTLALDWLRAGRRRLVVLSHGLEGYGRISTLAEFDDRFTAPLHGFASGAAYWAACNSRPCLARIRVPTLLVNAENDPILTPECFPVAEASDSRWLFLETPSAGGHCGFTNGSGPALWSERRAVAFAQAAAGETGTTAAG